MAEEVYAIRNINELKDQSGNFAQDPPPPLKTRATFINLDWLIWKAKQSGWNASWVAWSAFYVVCLLHKV